MQELFQSEKLLAVVLSRLLSILLQQTIVLCQYYRYIEIIFWLFLMCKISSAHSEYFVFRHSSKEIVMKSYTVQFLNSNSSQYIVLRVH